MRLLSLSLENLGPYRGPHCFPLQPVRSSDGVARPLILFSGHNGAGKSTLFQAIALALHGPQSFGDRVSSQAYSDRVLGLLHRWNGSGEPCIAEEGGVRLSLLYTQSGESLEIEIKRRWKRNRRSIQEHLSVVYNEERRPDVRESEYQTWINELIPPGLAPLCFFDTERLDALTAPEQHNAAVGNIVHRLLGLDLVDRLTADLNHQLVRGGSSPMRERSRREILERQAALAQVEAQIEAVEAERSTIEGERERMREALQCAEEQLLAEGGLYAARRPVLQSRLLEVRSELKAIHDQLHEMCGGLLPFTLAPSLCERLSDRLSRESEWHRLQVAQDLWTERVDAVARKLRNDELWHGVQLSERKRRELSERIIDILRGDLTANGAGAESVLHNLAEPEQKRLQGWIREAREDVPRRVGALDAQLRSLQAEEQALNAELHRAPDEEVLRPLYERIEGLKADLETLRLRENDLSSEIGGLRVQHQDRCRKLDQARAEYRKLRGSERQVELAERSKLVLRTYKDTLLRQRLSALEEALVESFNRICRKDQLLTSALFSPEDLSVRLQGADRQAYPLTALSAGERQLYALALLEALRRVSGGELPLLIDTPVARLDGVHRKRVLHHYLPHVARQTLLFATDAELDEGLLAEAEPHAAHIYRLRYDPEEQSTLAVHRTPAPPVQVSPINPLIKELTHVP